MAYNKGDRVQYRGQDGQQHTGQIQDAKRSGQEMTYVVKDEQTNREERLSERQIEREAR
ncbi:hypothetical protein GCM10020367_24700 [Streptomyces sannanensis]|uniref:Hypervirulence associated protein TUDOR domain-containing protein n=1 Tax=Streptomyces sannanensis TaxID=285536 RepID=A0ABP6SAN8_9ACTN